MLRAIFFDMGGTLDGDGHWLDRFVRLYGEQELAMPREAVRHGFDYAEQCAAHDEEIVHAGLEALVRRHLSWQFEAHDLHDAGIYEAMVHAFLTPVRMSARRNAAILADLRGRGYLLGVISNACGNAQALCDDLGYSQFLSLVIDSRVVGIAKPDPGIYRLALDRAGIQPALAMMVGDSYDRDVVPAHQVGMQTAWLVHAGLPPGPGVADVCITGLHELPSHLALAERAPA